MKKLERLADTQNAWRPVSLLEAGPFRWPSEQGAEWVQSVIDGTQLNLVE